MRATKVLALTIALTSATAACDADGLGDGIDLTTFGTVAVEPPSVWDDPPLQDVGAGGTSPERRLYVSGMIGPSFAQLALDGPGPGPAASDTLLAAGGALGMAFERHNGWLRVETEGMGRDTFFGPVGSIGPVAVGLLAASNWSVMQNVWRDVMVTERLGAYGGGGIGAGGYRLGVGVKAPGFYESEYLAAKAAFAWQFGGGLFYDVTDRLTFDVGYRYFNIDAIGYGGVTGPAFSGDFAANELMVGLRLFEPFRRWAD